MSKNKVRDNSNYSWNGLPEDTKAILTEKKLYEEKLTTLLENVRQAALGIDYQTKVHLKLVEKRIIDKLIEVEADIKTIISSTKSKINTLSKQGKLFDE